jgi:hypothetical protein
MVMMCQEGLFNEGFNRNPCRECDAGYTSVETGADSPTACVVRSGWALDAASGLPKPCDAGSFGTGGSAGNVGGSCTACPAGYSTQKDESVALEECNGRWRSYGESGRNGRRKYLSDILCVVWLTARLLCRPLVCSVKFDVRSATYTQAAAQAVAASHRSDLFQCVTEPRGVCNTLPGAYSACAHCVPAGADSSHSVMLTTCHTVLSALLLHCSVCGWLRWRQLHGVQLQQLQHGGTGRGYSLHALHDWCR